MGAAVLRGFEHEAKLLEDCDVLLDAEAAGQTHRRHDAPAMEFLDEGLPARFQCGDRQVEGGTFVGAAALAQSALAVEIGAKHGFARPRREALQ